MIMRRFSEPGDVNVAWSLVAKVCEAFRFEVAMQYLHSWVTSACRMTIIICGSGSSGGFGSPCFFWSQICNFFSANHGHYFVPLSHNC